MLSLLSSCGVSFLNHSSVSEAGSLTELTAHRYGWAGFAVSLMDSSFSSPHPNSLLSRLLITVSIGPAIETTRIDLERKSMS